VAECNRTNWPLEQEGSTGENVWSVQYFLNAHGAALAVDGIFGSLTAVKGYNLNPADVIDGAARYAVVRGAYAHAVKESDTHASDKRREFRPIFLDTAH
jgi:hypothetical protein